MRLLLLLCCLLLTTLLADSAAPGPTPPYAAQWKRIDALLAKEQTATAAPLVEQVYRQAKAEHNAPAYVRALLYKVRLLENKEQDADEKAIALLEADLKTATFPARPILHSLLAGLYTTYFDQHRYQLYQRTQGSAPTTDAATPGAADGGTSLTTWDARRLGSAIAHHYQRSVQDEPQRQLQTSLAALGDLATGGDAEGRRLRPTLYDLLAQRAISGLQNQELTVTQPEQPFSLAAYPTAALFGSAREFATLSLPTPAADSLSHELLTLRLLQQLTSQRLTQPGNPSALADVDRQRLTYLATLAKGTDQAAAYEPALARAAATYQDLPSSTDFSAQQVAARHEAGDEVAAVRLARAAEARFPQSPGAARARQLRLLIEQAELAVSAAELVVPGQPWRLALTTRNVAALQARAYRIPLAEWARFDEYRTDGDAGLTRHFARALQAKPAATWTMPVPAPPLDYQEQRWAAAGPALPAGYYLLVLSTTATTPAQSRAKNVTAYAALGASELSAVRQEQASGQRPGQLLVLQRQSGQPLAGIPVVADAAKGSRPAIAGRTDARGTATLPLLPKPTAGQARRGQASLRLSQGTDTLLVAGYEYYGRDADASEVKTQTRTFLFTDRAIYRPGQTLYFKGIALERRGNDTRLLIRQAQTVRLTDPNGQTVQTLEFTTSDFGSFNGSLVLPTGLLNGEFQLQTPSGSLTVSVEDYKRPTFLVQLDSVPGRPQLGQLLTVRGRAYAYAGQPTDGAAVQYRVTRRALWALFDLDYQGGRSGRAYRPGSPGRGTTEIAHGTTTTDAEGRFTVTFTPPLAPAQPGRFGWQPGFLFEVTADVTTAAGETRTGNRSFPIGRNPLSLRLAGPELADRRHLPAISLFGTNATGEPLPAAGTLRLLARRYRPNPPGVPGPAPQDREHEAPAELVKTLPFDTKNGATLDLAALLGDVPTGRYRLEALAAGADSARAQLDFTLYDSAARTVPFATPDWFVALADSVAPGQPASLLLGSSEADAHILLEVERGGQLLRQEWLTLTAGEQRRVAVESGPAAALGPLYVHTTQVRDNQLYQHTAQLTVAESARPLQLSISTFRDRLQPGQRETWRVTIHQANGRPAEAELLATLYDQSLDVFRRHSFQNLQLSEQYYPAVFEWQGEFGRLNVLATRHGESTGAGGVEYPELNTWGIEGSFIRRALLGRIVGVRAMASAPGSSPVIRLRGARAMASPPPPAPMAMGKVDKMADYIVTVKSNSGVADSADEELNAPAPDLTTVPTRSDFRETAFWQPALRTNAQGEVVLEFQMPEAVTRWQLLSLAHDKQLRTGQLARQLVTQKEVQITPNAPRFLRPGDSFTFAAQFANLTDAPVRGTAQLTLLDAATGQDITAQLLPGAAQQPVGALAHQSQAVGWPLAIPTDFAPVAVTYWVVASVNSDLGPTPPHVKYRTVPGKNGKLASKKLTKKERQQHFVVTFSDGEENTLPVLPNRVLVTESLPLPIVGPGTRTFELAKLTSTNSPTRRHQSLTLELTANPAWYAVQSLPYLLEYPYECSEQVFDRLYANLLAASILKNNPRIKPVLAEWTRQAQSGTAAQRETLASKLAQNQDLKNLLLQETPWVQDAQSETQRLARLSAFFDEARLQAETTRALAKLRALQRPDGSFPWFEKMPADRYITQLLVAGFGKLNTLGAFDASQDAAARPLLQAALGYLDQQLARDYAELRQSKNPQLSADHLGDLQVQALYARSYWLLPVVAPASRPALAYYQGQAARYWPGRTRYLQAQLALALHRTQASAAPNVMRALAENALHSPELGMYWQDVQPGYYWREAPTETQATLIEAFSEVTNDQRAVDEMKLWLLKQKQTQHWESTRATADACYALLLRGSDWLAPSPPLQISVGGEALTPPPAQAGTGYFTRTWPAAEVQPGQGKVTITKPTAGVAWGALYWQYFEDLDKVTPAASPLSLERQLYREIHTATGSTLEKLTAAAPLQVGNVLVVRLVLRTDRALEYVHLKDQRAAGLELIDQLSGYQNQAGLGYYQSPRDAATHFFFGAVPRGTHVFEYRLRASQRGNFSGGLSQVQCLYAPEFGATSAGQRLVIK